MRVLERNRSIHVEGLLSLYDRVRQPEAEVQILLAPSARNVFVPFSLLFSLLYNSVISTVFRT